MITLEKYKQDNFILPCVVDKIDYQKQMVLDVIQHKDQIFKRGQLLSYDGVDLIINKKLRDYPIQTQAKIEGRLDFRKVRYFCNKINQEKNDSQSSIVQSTT